MGTLSETSLSFVLSVQDFGEGGRSTALFAAPYHGSFLVAIDPFNVISSNPISSENSPIGAKSALSGGILYVTCVIDSLASRIFGQRVSKTTHIGLASSNLKLTIYSRIEDQALNTHRSGNHR